MGRSITFAVAIAALGVATIGAPTSAATVNVRPTTLRSQRAARCVVIPQGTSTSSAPKLVALGASFTAGVGAALPQDNWAVRFARLIGWQTLTVGVPGAGYVEKGFDHLGPLENELKLAKVSVSRANLVIVQAGHDDWRVPTAREATRVGEFVTHLEHDAPTAQLAFVTAFSRPSSDSIENTAIEKTNATIIATIRSTDPAAIIINPRQWRFPRASNGLHPTAKGYSIIAHNVERALQRDGELSTAISPRRDHVSCAYLN